MKIPVSYLLGNYEMLMLNAIEDLGYGMNPIESFLWVGDAFLNGSEVWKDFIVVHGHTPTMKLKRYIESNGITDFYFVKKEQKLDSWIRMRSMTVSNEEIFPWDLGLIYLGD